MYKFLSTGFEIAATVFLFFFIGLKIDQKFDINYSVIVFSFLGILCSLIILYQKVKKDWKIN